VKLLESVNFKLDCNKAECKVTCKGVVLTIKLALHFGSTFRDELIGTSTYHKPKVGEYRTLCDCSIFVKQ